RRCADLAHLVGDGPAPTPLTGWTLSPNDYPLPGDIAARQCLTYARAYFFYLHDRGPDVLPPYGSRRLRPARATDEVGRSLVFTYAHARRCLPPALCPGLFAFSETPEAELLVGVTGPGGTSLTFEYAQAPQV